MTFLGSSKDTLIADCWLSVFGSFASDIESWLFVPDSLIILASRSGANIRNFFF